MRKIERIKLIVVSALLSFYSLAFADLTSTNATAQDVIDFTRRVLQWVSTIFWIVAGIMVLYGGFLYMTAGGNDEQVKKAHRQLLYAVIAVAIGILAAGIPQLVQSFLKG